MFKFDFAFANHTHTNPALSLALTRADQYKRERWMSSPSILNVANSANIDTYWLSNQQLLGSWDNHTSVISKEANKVVTKNKLIGKARDAKEHDGVLLEEIHATLDISSNLTKLIIVHLQGSHASYCSRFPSEHAVFEGVPATVDTFGNLAKVIARTNNGIINCYDNSIRYTDYVLSKIIEILEKESKPTSLLYFSDHSEDVIGNKAHNSTVFTFDMAEIPMVFWSNKYWKQHFPVRWHNLKNNQLKDFTNDHIFETVAGLLGVSSPDISRENDLSSNLYIEADITTLHGRKKLKSHENFAYWQRKNISNLEKKSCLKLLPHRVNSLGKAKEALVSGVCGLEIDIIIERDDEEYILRVGHDKERMTSLSLADFLEGIQSTQLKKLWLDVKNLNSQNIAPMLTRLNELDDQFDLKKITLVETSSFDADVSRIPEQGYKLSYYLPTAKILDSMKKGDEAQSQLAKEIVKRIEIMGARNISFDLRLYSFVKNNLEPRLDNLELMYHSWFPHGFSFSTPNLIEGISTKNYFLDTKMDTILLPYASPFSL